MFSDKKLKLLFKVETIRFYDLEPSFSEVYYPATAPVSGFDAKNSVRPTSATSMFSKFLHARNGPWIETDEI